jgi:hypothetical protein
MQGMKKAKLQKDFINKIVEVDDKIVLDIFIACLGINLKPTVGKLGSYSYEDKDCCYKDALREIYNNHINLRGDYAPFAFFNLGYLQAVADREELVEYDIPKGFMRKIKAEIKAVFAEMTV